MNSTFNGNNPKNKCLVFTCSINKKFFKINKNSIFNFSSELKSVNITINARLATIPNWIKSKIVVLTGLQPRLHSSHTLHMNLQLQHYPRNHID